ncbi:hypothetical protein F0L68_39620 [Solihabitans fulvus]|uniref:HNH endonuclease n=1 Tax=Solihabitans fulvus TaxID=1892852 RepID=A0A5B2W9Y7_9PSEU|nr:hypothetical protein [Solihabitans fulvus]KAA2248741.1 hypothetical protein F0L68_39620 [Solihabitans fulvus]
MKRSHALLVPLVALFVGALSTSVADAASAQSCVALNGRADVRCTPGAFNPNVTQSTIGSTICVSGWTATVRPPASYTTALKNQQKIAYGEANISNSDLEEDHLVPLELGGAPRDPNNLWPQPRASVTPPGQGAETKDREENALKVKVCNGSLTLAQARQQILAYWTH